MSDELEKLRVCLPGSAYNAIRECVFQYAVSLAQTCNDEDVFNLLARSASRGSCEEGLSVALSKGKFHLAALLATRFDIKSHHPYVKCLEALDDVKHPLQRYLAAHLCRTEQDRSASLFTQQWADAAFAGRSFSQRPSPEGGEQRGFLECPSLMQGEAVLVRHEYGSLQYAVTTSRFAVGSCFGYSGEIKLEYMAPLRHVANMQGYRDDMRWDDFTGGIAAPQFYLLPEETTECLSSLIVLVQTWTRACSRAQSDF